MKITKKEIVIAIILTVVGLVGRYYLSWHCTLAPEARYIWKFIWITGMVMIGYAGLRGHELSWVSQLWLVVNCLLLICFGIDKLMTIHYHQSAIFRVSSYQFTSPVSFLGACCIPRLFVTQFKKHANARRDN